MLASSRDGSIKHKIAVDNIRGTDQIQMLIRREILHLRFLGIIKRYNALSLRTLNTLA